MKHFWVLCSNYNTPILCCIQPACLHSFHNCINRFWFIHCVVIAVIDTGIHITLPVFEFTWKRTYTILKISITVKILWAIALSLLEFSLRAAEHCRSLSCIGLPSFLLFAFLFYLFFWLDFICSCWALTDSTFLVRIAPDMCIRIAGFV